MASLSCITMYMGRQSSPVQSSPVQSNPVQSSPIQSNPVQSSPVQSSPIQSNPVQSSPIQSSPVNRLLTSVASRSAHRSSSFLQSMTRCEISWSWSVRETWRAAFTSHSWNQQPLRECNETGGLAWTDCRLTGWIYCREVLKDDEWITSGEQMARDSDCE